MVRTRSPLRVTPESGDEYGIFVTDADRRRCAFLARWYCLSKHNLARAEQPPEVWHPHAISVAGVDPEWAADQAASAAYAIRRRLTKLARVQPNSGNHTGPLVGSALVHDSQTAWFATRYGATAADVPWWVPPVINPMFAAHAWTAADVGMQLERLGHRVLSEREMSTGIDAAGDEVTIASASKFTPTNGTPVQKKPDLAVLGQGGRYIAVEVERRERRPPRVYREKLEAYEANPAISAVWYLCGSENVRKRVVAAAEKVFGNRTTFPLRIQLLRNLGGFYEVAGLTPVPELELPGHPRLLADLAALNTQSEAGR